MSATSLDTINTNDQCATIEYRPSSAVPTVTSTTTVTSNNPNKSIDPIELSKQALTPAAALRKLTVKTNAKFKKMGITSDILKKSDSTFLPKKTIIRPGLSLIFYLLIILSFPLICFVRSLSLSLSCLSFRWCNTYGLTLS